MIKSKKHLAYTLQVQLSELETLSKNSGNYYKEKKVFKRFDGNKNPVYRVINPSQKRLKIIQKRIHKRILQKLDFGDYAYGAVSGRDNVDNAKKHQGKKYKLTTDLKNFFPSISCNEVFQMFRRNGFSPTISRILTQLTTFEGRVPQGAPTSSSIANLVFKKLGDDLELFAMKYGFTFTTFVDDITFSSPNDFHDKVPQILGMIQEYYQINHRKTAYSRSPNVTGLHPLNNHLGFSNNFSLKLNSLEGRTAQEKQGILLYKEKVDRINGK